MPNEYRDKSVIDNFVSFSSSFDCRTNRLNSQVTPMGHGFDIEAGMRRVSDSGTVRNI